MQNSNMYNIANTLYLPFSKKIGYNTAINSLNADIIIQKTNNGYDVEIKNLDLSFLDH